MDDMIFSPCFQLMILAQLIFSIDSSSIVLTNMVFMAGHSILRSYYEIFICIGFFHITLKLKFINHIVTLRLENEPMKEFSLAVPGASYTRSCKTFENIVVSEFQVFWSSAAVFIPNYIFCMLLCFI